MSIRSIVHSLGGIATKRQLVARGANDRHLTEVVRNGEVFRARNGCYSTFDPSDPRFMALRVGGRLTGLSAVAALGGWVEKPPPLHVSVSANASRLRRHDRRRPLGYPTSAALVVHWDPIDLSARGDVAIVALRDALMRVVLDESWEVAVAALDWALHTRSIDRLDLEWILLQLPPALQEIADWVDENCESLPESLARTRLRMAGHRVTSQVGLRQTERIDLVVDECVGIEVDGEQFHIGSFFRDRDKDIAITLQGLHALRPTANHVFHDWPRFYDAVVMALQSRSRAVGNSGVRAPRTHPRRRTPRLRGGESRRVPAFPTGRRE